MVLIEWTEKIGPDEDIEFEPQYAVHILGLGFSDIAPDAFQESGRLLRRISLHRPVLQRPQRGYRMFQCMICGQRFNSKDNMTRHLRNRHDTEPESEPEGDL